MAMVFCTNTNSFHHEDHYDGRLYQFPPGDKVPIPEEAARHMFGFREADKTATLHRLGWGPTKYDSATKTFVDDTEGLNKLAKFKFSEAKLVESKDVPAELKRLPTDNLLAV